MRFGKEVLDSWRKEADSKDLMEHILLIPRHKRINPYTLKAIICGAGLTERRIQRIIVKNCEKIYSLNGKETIPLRRSFSEASQFFKSGRLY